jgi:antitoxin MazE
MTVIVRKLGGSLAVVVPKAMAQEMQLTDGTALDISTTDGALVMQRRGRRPRRPLSKIVSGIKASAYRRHREISDDGPVGKEIW